ncbi:MAG: nucleolar DEAD-box protein required for synthesis of 60S ribosomal subunit [Bogoriella megaspora]|nr:MAG: nucleolar DEAD-box protein required for synthesis of 60S ribosomal subunit [Bogoriella megaspora]
MTPTQNGGRIHEEFVFTISDDETVVPNLDETGHEEPTSLRTIVKSSKKRKRQDEDFTEGRSIDGIDQDFRSTRTIPNLQKGTQHSASGMDVHSESNGEDDGAMDSDFEFYHVDVEHTDSDESRGWEPGRSRYLLTDARSNEAVDIDKIIQRRRKGVNSPSISRNGISRMPSDDESGNGEVDEEGSFVDSTEGVDESLAPDGFKAGFHTEEKSDDSELENINQQDSGDAKDVDIAQHAVPEDLLRPNDSIASTFSDDDIGDEQDPIEAERRAAFFAPEPDIASQTSLISSKGTSFQDMSLSRPILRGLGSVGFSSATPIQTKAIPIALLGKDVVGGAETGSGKTAAFMIPILERLLYRPKKVPTSRVVVLMPTRELAVQCFNVSVKLASFTDITMVQLVGGFSPRDQEQQLKKRPDIIIATPGRFIDHMLNTPSFVVDTIEILVLDEADRMLEDGFADELDNILKTLPRNRQTMLFSATMTQSVDKLIRVGLNRPARLMINAKRQTVSGLIQEFIRLRPGKEDKRLAYLMYLCTSVYTGRAIVFFRQKKEVHRVRVVFALCGLKAGELHGSMSQEQRNRAVEDFRSGVTSFLLATDLASRGLDIRNVSTVLNFSAPQNHDLYLHRVGRTARAGRSGRACTLAAESDRKVVKQAVKVARAQDAKVVSRTVPGDEADHWAERLNRMNQEIDAILQDEKEERAMAQAEMHIRKGDNLIKYEDEIKSRPKRTWFETGREKQAAKERGRAELNGDMIGGKKRARTKLSGKEKKSLNDRDERLLGRTWKKGKEERAGKGTIKNVGKAKKQHKLSKRNATSNK